MMNVQNVRQSTAFAFFAVTVLSAITLKNAAQAQGHGKEFIYCGAAGGSKLYKLDSETGIRLDVIYTGGPQSVEVDNYCSWRGRLVGVGRIPSINPLNEVLYERNASDGSYSVISSLNEFFISRNIIDVDPTTGRMYGILDHKLYELDPSSGRHFLIGPISGVPLQGAWAMGISPKGVCYIPNNASNFHRIEFFELDLGTGHGSSLGSFSMDVGSCGDLAFDAAGDLWMCYNAANAMRSGLYKIDFASMTATHMFPELLTEFDFHGAPTAISFLRDSAWHLYCAGKLNSLGCTPEIAASGIANPGARRGFKIWATQVRNQSSGILLYSLGGPTALPYLGGTLCVTTPYMKSALVSSGGSSYEHQDCSGRWEVDFNSIMFAAGGLPAGLHVQAQFFGRDAGLDPDQAVSFSNAVDFELVP